jgi:hypothetical protein
MWNQFAELAGNVFLVPRSCLWTIKTTRLVYQTNMAFFQFFVFKDMYIINIFYKLCQQDPYLPLPCLDFTLIVCWWTLRSFFGFFLCRPSDGQLTPSSFIPSGDPPFSWQYAVGWINAGFKPATAGTQRPRALPVSNHIPVAGLSQRSQAAGAGG